MNPKKQPAAKSRPQEVVNHDWCAPVSADAPCGIDLEYDPEYVVMSAKSTAQPDAQYGNFVGSADPVNWSEIDRDWRRDLPSCAFAGHVSRCYSSAASRGY